MIERKDTPAPFMQRQRQPPPPLDIRPNRKHATKSDSPPLTPPPYRVRTRGKRAPKAQATPRETYLNGLAGGDNARGGDEPVRNERISHDLSLTNNTRSSVVDSMLLSLNPDQPKIFSTPPENQSLTTSSRLTSPRGSHRRGHTQSSSLTDHAIPLDDSPLRSSGQLSRGHHSNSSSNFQSALGRIDSIHGDDEDKPDKINAKILEIQRRTVGERTSEVRTLRKSRKSSKSSGASSVDFGHITGQPRWQSTMTRRSSSFDHGRIRGAYTSSSNPVARSPTVHDTSRILQYDISDAAPTPTIPAGPRSKDSPVFPPPPSYAPPQMPTTQRKNSVDSSKSYRNRSNRGDLTWESGTVQGDDKTDQRPEGHDVPSVPAFIISRNPSPTRHPQEVFIGHRQATVFHTKDSPKERPGFFRRVFGSSRNPHQSTLEARLPQLQSSQNSIRAESRGGFASPHKLTKPPPTDDSFHLLKENVQPTLVKKPSSFFRRRKKSISEHFPPPALSMRLHPDFQPNPIVPLISQGPGSSPPHHDDASSQAIRSNDNTIFSSDLDPTKATIKPVFPSQESLSGGVAGSPRQHQSADVGPMVQDTPRGGAKPKVDDFLALHSNSFLHDTSSTETKTVQSIDNAGTSNTGLVPSHAGPTSNPTDMVNVDEKQIIDAMSVDPLDDPLRRTREASGKPKVLPSRSEAFSAPSSVSGNASNTLRNQYPRLNSQFTTTTKKLASAGTSDKSARAWLDPDDSEDEFDKLDRMNSHVDVAQRSPASAYHSAASTLPAPWTRDLKDDIDTSDQSLIVDEAKPTDDDRIQARMIYEGEETFVPKATAAAWLGGSEPSRSRVRRAYMELFDWQNLNILVSLRIFCSRLLLKGETQQVDRILDAFSLRWCVCNPKHGFKATDVVHTICYSILLLNTDLHMADIEQKMSRAQFVKNTLPTIRRVAADATPSSLENHRASILPGVSPWAKPSSERTESPTFQTEQCDGRRSFEGARPCYRLSSRPSDQSGYLSSQPATPVESDAPNDDCGPLVKSQFRGKMSSWELQIEIVLKDFFNSIRQQRLPLHGNENKENLEHPPQHHTLSSVTGNLLRRTPSMISKAGSENFVYRGRTLEHRLETGRWTSKTRSRPRLYPSSTVGSSRTSLEDQSSTWSPALSSTWSKYSLGKTQTSMSVDSFGSNFPQGGYHQSIGFANALSQAIIREESSGGEVAEETMRNTPFLEDESLELAGAPWAKEGILKHKHHLESVDKRAKDRNWVETFAVIEKGWMSLFSFSMNAKSMRQKAKNQKAPGGVVGGGNWADSAESLGKFLLRQTIASALPPPGYSKTRQHVWALSLPTGAVHFFQVGTPEIVKEFVSTANYWSARLSKEPLVGAISNIEYGWSHSVINAALLPAENVPAAPAASGPRPSLQNSVRSSVDQGSFKPKLPGDKIIINDWTFPQQSMMASVLLEVDQLKALTTYVKNIEEELQKHNELRAPMLLAFTPRHPNSTKAMANWERKSSYLLREIVKFQTYIDCLQAAQAQKEKIYAARAAAAEFDGDKEKGKAAGQEEKCTTTTTTSTTFGGSTT